MPFHGKKYQLVSSENFDEFLKAAGMDQDFREAVVSLKPTVELRRDGDSYSFHVFSSFKNNQFKFLPGQEVHEEFTNGVKMPSVYSFEGNKLTQIQKCPNGLEISYVREFEPDQMTAVLTADNVTCTRIYKAI